MAENTSNAPTGATGPVFTVCVFTGHTGGHLYPAVAFAECLRRRYPGARLHLISSRRAQSLAERLVPGVFDEAHFLVEFPFPSGISLNLFPFLLKFPLAFWETFQCLAKVRPDLSVGFGSYASYPGIVLSALRRIPTVIHEQNLQPGKATRSLLPFAEAVAVSFPPTLADAGLKERVVTGLPVRGAFWDSAGDRGRAKSMERLFHRKTFQILVVGGSQGAQRINEAAVEAIRLMSREEKNEIAVNHITGKRDFEKISEIYRQLKVQHKVYSFFESMHELYAEADMAITRAGAGTLSELALFGLPAVIIPYPHAGNHQKANADFFQSREAVIQIPEKDLSPESLSGIILTFKRDPALRRKYSENLSKLACPNAAESLANLAWDILQKHSRGGGRTKPL